MIFWSRTYNALYGNDDHLQPTRPIQELKEDAFLDNVRQTSFTLNSVRFRRPLRSLVLVDEFQTKTDTVTQALLVVTLTAPEYMGVLSTLTEAPFSALNVICGIVGTKAKVLLTYGSSDQASDEFSDSSRSHGGE
ncbi:hypothetical protein ABKN59_006684 [Abortiporus biennis]